MASMIIIPVIKDNNFLLFKNNVEYAWVRFMQVSKITNRSMTMFFINFNLTLMQEYLNYKNINKMRTFLTKLPYSKIIS